MTGKAQYRMDGDRLKAARVKWCGRFAGCCRWKSNQQKIIGAQDEWREFGTSGLVQSRTIYKGGEQMALSRDAKHGWNVKRRSVLIASLSALLPMTDLFARASPAHTKRRLYPRPSEIWGLKDEIWQPVRLKGASSAKIALSLRRSMLRFKTDGRIHRRDGVDCWIMADRHHNALSRTGYTQIRIYMPDMWLETFL